MVVISAKAFRHPGERRDLTHAEANATVEQSGTQVPTHSTSEIPAFAGMTGGQGSRTAPPAVVVMPANAFRHPGERRDLTHAEANAPVERSGSHVSTHSTSEIPAFAGMTGGERSPPARSRHSPR
ncbi:MAG: hypothetical protein IPL41_17185 [Micropruina sp.]|nr:hypothetical protein [Micropruina sp.]